MRRGIIKIIVIIFIIFIVSTIIAVAPSALVKVSIQGPRPPIFSPLQRPTTPFDHGVPQGKHPYPTGGQIPDPFRSHDSTLSGLYGYWSLDSTSSLKGYSPSAIDTTASYAILRTYDSSKKDEDIKSEIEDKINKENKSGAASIHFPWLEIEGYNWTKLQGLLDLSWELEMILMTRENSTGLEREPLVK